jgi:beta-lactamase regulating signal transducer with metallopeptidase domain
VIGGLLERLLALVAPERPLAEALAVAAAWQSTVLLALGLLAARLLRRRPSRAHAALCLALAASVLAPLATVAADHAGLGLLPAPRAVESSSATRAPLVDVAASRAPLEAPATKSVARPADSAPPSDAAPAPATPTPAILPRVSAGQVLAALWGTAALAVLVAVLRAWRRTRRLLREAAPCEDARPSRALEAARARLGVRERVALLVSADVGTPVLWGFGVPRLVLPAASVGAQAPRIAWDTVLAHELAHLRRGDHRARLLGFVALVALPLHPLVWLTSRALVRSSEQACDDWALHGGAPAADYAESLLAFAGHPPVALAIGAVGRRGDLRARLTRIVRDRRVAPQLGRGWSAGALAAGALLLAGLACVQTRPAGAEPERTATATLGGTVVDEAGQPVPGAEVSFWRDYLQDPRHPADDDWSDQHPQSVTTDAKGHFLLTGLREGWIDLLVDHPDYARLFGPTGDERSPTGHDDLVLVLRPGPRLDGRVLADGQPLAGVTVVTRYGCLASQPIGRDAQAVTDADGRFSFAPTFDGVRLARVGADANFPNVDLVLSSPDWIAPVYHVQEPDAGAGLPFVEIQAQRRTPEMADEEWHGESVSLGRPTSGTVARRNGEPVGDATLLVHVTGPIEGPGTALRDVVLDGTLPDGKELERYTSVERDAPGAATGHLLFDQLPPGKYRLYTPNWGPVVFSTLRVELAEGQRAELTWTPGSTLVHGRVSCAGQPIGRGAVEVIALATDAHDFQMGFGHVKPDGTWDITGLPPGRYRMTWCDDEKRNSGLVPLVVDVHAADVTQDFDLPRTRIDVQLADGQPLPNHLEMTILTPGTAPLGGNSGALLTITPESHIIEHVPPGRWTVTDQMHKLSAQVTLEGPDSSAVAKLDTANHGRELITGQLVDWKPDGSGKSFEIHAYPKDAFGLDLTREYGEPDARPDGSFRITHLPAGTYGLLIMPTDGKGWLGDNPPCLYVPDVSVGDGRSPRCDVAVPPSRRVSFKLSGSSLLCRWRVALHDEDWLPFSLFLGSSPRALVAQPGALPLPVGEHKVLVERGDEPPRIVVVRVEPGEDVQEIDLDG